ncbi:MAG TPA: ParB/RepB/Spo0J family partition protein [Pseudonocardiaceae bacterium]
MAAPTTSPGVTVVQLPISRLRHHPNNVRRSLGDLRELTGSIRQLGVLQPLLVERRGEVYRILAGHRRHTAARLAGRRTVPCVITRPVDDATAIGLMLTENLQRADLTRQEKAAAARALRDRHGLTVAEVADRLGVAPSTVYGWLAEPTAVATAQASAETGGTAATPATPASSRPAAAPEPSPRRSRLPASTTQPPPLPVLTRSHAVALHQLVADYDRHPGTSGVDRAAASQGLRDAVAGLLGDWTPGAPS